MSSFDLMTSPPTSNAPSPSLASLARLPSLSPSYVAPIPRRAIDTTSAIPASPPPRSPGCLPSMLDRPPPNLPSHMLPRGSHSELVGSNPSNPTFQDTDLFAARLARPSCPAPILTPILNVTIGSACPTGSRPTQSRKPSFQIPLPLPSAPDMQYSFAQSTRPSLAVQLGGKDENASRRSSYNRTPYPIEEAADYMSSQGVDIRKVHPCDKGMSEDGGIQWGDPWAETSENIPLSASSAIPQDVDPKSDGKREEAVGNRKKVGSVDVCNWSSAGMEQAWSADSQSAVEGDSLMVSP